MRILRKIKLVLIPILLTAFIVPGFVYANHGDVVEHKQDHKYPRLLNYYLTWTLNEEKAKELAKWDVVVMDMEQQMNNPELLRKMRDWNEDIILLAYITPQEIRTDVDQLKTVSPLRYKLSQGIKDSWYLKNSSGENMSWWPGTRLLNITNEAPSINGQKFNDYMAKFVVEEILGTGLWDGVFYDNSWDNITYFAGKDVDLNLDGKSNTDWKEDAKWRRGMRALYEKTRKMSDKKIVLVGNNNTKKYTDQLNGIMLENFSQKKWNKIMNTYKYNNDQRKRPSLNMVNNNAENQWDKKDFQDMRFGLTSSLLEDGYYSYDYGDKNHGQTWWYDEYEVNLGNPVSESKPVYGPAKKQYKSGVWTRDFENGFVVVNSTDNTRKVDLGSEYEKIKGEAKVNDGSISSEFKIKSKDGLVLLKTFDILKDIVFTNGYFAKLYKKSGNKVRNGFFVFDDKYNGGDKVAYIDMNGNHKRERIVYHEGKLNIWRHDGLLYARTKVFDNRLDQVDLTIDDIVGDSKKEVVLSPSKNSSQPIKIYSIYGKELKSWYPFGKKYKNGYSATIGKFIGSTKQIAVKNEANNRVYIYSNNFHLVYSWHAKDFDNFNIASGSTDKAFHDRIVLSDGDSVGVFNFLGHKIDGFNLSSSLPFTQTDVEVKVKDVNFDNQEDIVLFEKI